MGMMRVRLVVMAAAGEWVGKGENENNEPQPVE
jgi:hypothetical protein